MIFVYEKRRTAFRLSNGAFKKFLRNEILFKFVQTKAKTNNRKSKNFKQQGANAGFHHRTWKYQKLNINNFQINFQMFGKCFLFEKHRHIKGQVRDVVFARYITLAKNNAFVDFPLSL